MEKQSDRFYVVLLCANATEHTHCTLLVCGYERVTAALQIMSECSLYIAFLTVHQSGVPAVLTGCDMAGSCNKVVNTLI